MSVPKKDLVRAAKNAYLEKESRSRGGFFIEKPIQVMAEPIYLEEESEPHAEQFVWSYQITIENKSQQAIKLRRRHWKITDSNGLTHEIKGDGVVGLEPVVRPGESFSYTSGAVLSAPSGIMFGNYEMEDHKGKSFEVSIPAFSLDSPHESHKLH